MSPDAFREELFTVLNRYHVEIVKTAGARGRPAQKTFRRSFGSAAGSSAAAEAGAAGAAGADAPAADSPAPPAPVQPVPAQPEAANARGGGWKTEIVML
jgi:hypothetical protein